MEQQLIGVAQYPIYNNFTSHLFNKHIKIDNKLLCNNSRANQGINHVGQLFNENGMTKAWLNIKT